MDPETKMRFDARAHIIKALAHPTRLFIVRALSCCEYCVCALTEMIGVDVSTVSKHLTILKNAGIVRDEKRGLQVYYRLRCGCIPDFLDCLERLWAENAREQSSLLSADDTERPAAATADPNKASASAKQGR